jgi:hypothetical protein
MNRYYMTFQVRHPLHDGWLEILAADENEARRKIFEFQGDKWAFLYDKATWPEYAEVSFPRGCIAVVE